MKQHYKPGSLARSLAGRDKGCVYVILEENSEYVILADGRYKTVNKPKCKNKKHVQPICCQNPGIQELLARRQPVTNEAVKIFIRAYERERKK